MATNTFNISIQNGTVNNYIGYVVGESGYALPENVSVVGANLTSWDKQTGTIQVNNFSSTVNIIVNAYQETYTITKILTHITATGDSAISPDGVAAVFLRADDGFMLPQTITVVGCDYTYDSAGGILSLYDATGNVTITASAEALVGVVLYQNTTEEIRIGKTLTTVGSLTGTFRNECSITKPVFIVEQATLPTFNYAYISMFNRYYFVTEIKSIRYKLWEIYFDVDVLETYKTGILKLSPIVSRNEFYYNNKLVDNRRVSKVTKSVTRIANTQEPEVTLWETPTSMDLTSQTTLDGTSIVFVSKPRIVLTVNSIQPPLLTYGTTKMFTTSSANKKFLFDENELKHFYDVIKGFSFSGIFSNYDVSDLISVKIYPFNFYALNDNSWNLNEALMVGSTPAIEMGMCRSFDWYASKNNEFDMLHFYITSAHLNWIDFESTYSIFLPFYGFVNLPIDEIIDHYMCVKYVIDFNTGLCLAKIGYATDSQYNNFIEIMRFNFNIAIDIPFSTSNSNEIMRAILQTGALLLGAASFGVSTAISVPEVAASSAPQLTAGSQLVPAGTTATYSSYFDFEKGFTPKSDIIQKPYAEIGRKDLASTYARQADKFVHHLYRGGNGGNPAFDICSSPTPYILKMRPNYIEDTNFAKENGYPEYASHLLSSLHGYTECVNVKIQGEDFATALQHEIAEIKSRLENGVILPSSV